MSCTVSVLICSNRRPGLLKQCLNALASGKRLPDQLVVVADLDQETAAVVEDMSARFPTVKLIKHPNHTLAGQRNAGLPHCTGDIIALTDDDAIPLHDWVAEICAAHERAPEAGGIGGDVLATDPSAFLSRIAELVVFPRPHPGRRIYTLPTVNLSYKRTVLDAVGEFDESLFRGEDVDYNWRVLRLHRTLVFDPAIQVRHRHRSTLSDLYQQQYMYGRAYVLVRRKWPDMYCVFPHRLSTLRDWAKLAHCLMAIVYQPFLLARRFLPRRERPFAFAVLVVHHLVWKLGMLRQLLLACGSAPRDRQGSRVLFFSHTGQWGGGAEVMLGQMMVAARARGRAVELLTPPGPLAARLSQDALVHVLPLTPPRRSGDPLTFLNHGWSWLAGTVALAGLISKRRPDVIHANSGTAALQTAVAATIARRPLIWHQYDIVPERRINRLVLAPCAYLSRRVVACSEAVRSSLRRISVPDRRITVLHNRVRDEFFEPLPNRQESRRMLHLDARAAVILTVGRLVPYKSQLTLIDAVALLRAQGREIELIILGETPSLGEQEVDPFPEYAGELRRAARENLAGHVHFLGYRKDVRTVLAAADMLVHPAIEESFPIALLEAQASGIPVIASCSGGHPEAVRDGETGVLFPPGDAASLAGAIDRLISAPEFAATLAGAARAEARERYQARDLEQLLDELYRQVSTPRRRHHRRGRAS